MKIGIINSNSCFCSLCEFNYRSDDPSKVKMKILEHLKDFHNRLMIHMEEGKKGKIILHGVGYSKSLFSNDWEKMRPCPPSPNRNGT